MESNPYKSLPDYQFWRRAVTDIEPFRLDPVVTPRFVIDKSDRVATAGSCFAQHISNRLQRENFNFHVTETGDHLPENQRRSLNYGVFSARYGNVYTTRQLLQLFQECFFNRHVAEPVWALNNENFVDALRPQVEPGGMGTEDEIISERCKHLDSVRKVFMECDVFIFTLGLTEAWKSRVDGTVYPLAPGVSGGTFEPEKHEFINFTVSEVIDDLNDFLQELKKFNANVKVILTVSPIPLIATYEPRHVLVSTTYSKSVLRVAAETVYQHYDWVEYFPAYEIMTGNYSNSIYYEDDYRNINTLGVDHAMRCFMHHYTSSSTGLQEGSSIPNISSNADVLCDEEAIEQTNI